MDMNLLITLNHDGIKLNLIQVTSDLKRQVHEAQASDEFLQKKKLIEQNNG